MPLSAKDLNYTKRGREEVMVLQTKEMAKRFQIAQMYLFSMPQKKEGDWDMTQLKYKFNIISAVTQTLNF